MTTNDINAIRQLLINDMSRLKAAERTAEDLQEAIDRWSQVKDESDVVHYHDDLRRQRQIADEARQAFAARTEMLQYIDLGDLTADELVASAVGAPGGGLGGGPAAPGADPTPTVSAARTIDQDVRNFLDTHHG